MNLKSYIFMAKKMKSAKYPIKPKITATRSTLWLEKSDILRKPVALAMKLVIEAIVPKSSTSKEIIHIFVNEKSSFTD